MLRLSAAGERLRAARLDPRTTDQTVNRQTASCSSPLMRASSPAARWASATRSVGLLRARREPRDRRGDALGAGGRLGHVAVHLVGRRGLLLDRRGDGGLEVVDLTDDRADLADRVDGAGGVGLDGLDPLGDVLGRPGGLLGQLLDLAGHDGEALAGLPRPSRLDGGVEGEQVGLLGDPVDELDDLGDLLGRVAELADRPRVFSATETA